MTLIFLIFMNIRFFFICAVDCFSLQSQARERNDHLDTLKLIWVFFEKFTIFWTFCCCSDKEKERIIWVGSWHQFDERKRKILSFFVFRVDNELTGQSPIPFFSTRFSFRFFFTIVFSVCTHSFTRVYVCASSNEPTSGFGSIYILLSCGIYGDIVRCGSFVSDLLLAYCTDIRPSSNISNLDDLLNATYTFSKIKKYHVINV